MQGLLADALSCPITDARQSHKVVDARVGLSDLIGSRAQEDSFATEASKEVFETLPDLVDKEVVILEVSAPTSEVLLEEDAIIVASLSTLVISKAEPSPRLEEVGVLELH